MQLTQSVHHAVQQTPDLTATIFGDRVRTWAESVDRVARLAAALTDLGVRQGDRIGLLALNSDIYHEFLLAVPWADAVLMPINTRWSANEIAFSLRDSDTRVLYVDDTFAPMAPQLRELAPCLENVIEGAAAVDRLIADHEPAPDARRGGDSLAGIFYTGGTTAQPKGVMLSHNNMMVSALGAVAATNTVPGGRYLHVAPMFHLAALSGWLLHNVVGGTHVLLSPFTPVGMADAIERHRVTDTLVVPTMLQLLVDSPATAEHDLSSLRRLAYGASPISDALLDRSTKRLPDTEFTQAYGMTELAPIATLLGPDAHQVPRLRRSAGRAAPHVEVLIVNEHDVEVPRGDIGEVVARGDNVMLGYWNRPEETSQALRGGWLHTGDAGYMDEDGFVFLVDRLRDMIVSGGENVYSAEVENALAKHPAVAACAVIGVPDGEWGERVHAVVVAVDGVRPTVDELRDHVKEHIAGYKAPRSIEFIEVLPLSGAGKVLKRELRSRHWAGRDRSVS
ncbi:acyl-CoA synthetase [Kutzneria sp. CA-103260]|uniref:acyl-CoA synthetase n=1 Tax=Kutzneria sp. CA-103260 TaxID=2802641 RepID=UPI001BADC993|nr:long-chain fatty acid--CoA ligase [Kutzneria sp. CA-103260]QUQ62427.1 feruloyl-CoA synthetase [Kutzneria sp. CA-103260]